MAGEASDRFVGRTLHGTFVVDRPLGEGGMGVVYLAHNAKTPGIRYALKVLRADAAGVRSAVEIQRFRREAQALAALDHPNIVRPIHVDATEAGEPYLVMEYVPGRSLREHIEQAYVARARLPTRFVLAVLDAIADALDHAHARGIVHRDLKPENVVVVEGARAITAKVLDFGVAKIFQPDGQSTDTLTRTSEIAGTVAYMSPEQCRDVRDAGAASDRFTLGLIAYEMLANVRPFDGRNAANTISNILLNPMPSVTAERPELPAVLDAVLARACDKSPAARYPTAAAFVSAVSDALGIALGGAPSQPAPALASSPSAREPAATGRGSGDADARGRPVSGVEATGPAVRLDELTGDTSRDGGEGSASQPPLSEPPASQPPASQPPAFTTATPSDSGARRARHLGIGAVLGILASSALAAAALVVAAVYRPPGRPRRPAAASIDRTAATLNAPAAPSSACAGRARESMPGLFDDEVCVPAGAFFMGSPEGEGDYDEHPRHRVTLRAFYVDRYEVTVARYRACVHAGACTADGLGTEGPYDDQGRYDPRGRRFRASPRCTWTAEPSPGDARPINCLSHAQAAAVCRFQGRRLLSEAEWERVARGGGNASADPPAPRAYPWGDAPPDCNYASFGAGVGCGLAAPAPVGTARAGESAEGVLDLAGNVAEWTSDWYSDEYYSHAPADDPPGATLELARLHGGDAVICRDGCRVTRGGAWNTPLARVALLRGAHRAADAYTRRAAHLGVRCARTP